MKNNITLISYKNLLRLGTLEVFIGLLILLISISFDFFVPATFIAGSFGIVAIAFCFLRPSEAKTYDVLAASILLAYGLGSLNSVVTSIQEGVLSSLFYFTSDSWLLITLGLIVVCAGLLHIVGRLVSHGYLYHEINFSENHFHYLLVLLCAFLAIYSLQLIGGGIGYMGMKLESGENNISVLASLILVILNPFIGLCTYAAIKDNNRSRKKVFLLILSIILLSEFFLGRRIFVIGLIVMLMTAIYFLKPKKILTLKNSIIIVFLVLLTQLATTSFYYLRLATYTYSGGVPKITNLIPEAYKLFKDVDATEVLEDMNEKKRTRTFVIEYLANLSESVSASEPLYGENLYRAVIISIPSIIYPEKYYSKYFLAEEDFANPIFGLPLTDNANSLLTAAVIDFGLLGIVFLPVIVCYLLSALINKVALSVNPVVNIVINMMLLTSLLSIENDISTLLNLVRNILLVWLVSFPFSNKNLRKI